MDAEARRRSRHSDLGVDLQPDEEDPTFVFRFPESAAQPAADDSDVDVDSASPAEGRRSPAPTDDEAEIHQDLQQDQQSLHDHVILPPSKPKRVSSRKPLKKSKHGIEYSSLPSGAVKKLANTFARIHGGSGKLSKDTLAIIEQASDWFFEQAAEDLASYSKHAGRKTVDESDVVALMKRYVVSIYSLTLELWLQVSIRASANICPSQRQLTSNTTLFSLGQKFLPRELLQGIRMPASQTKGQRSRPRLDSVEEESE